MEVREAKSGGMHSGRYQEMKEQGRIHKEVKDMVIKSVTNFPFCCVTNNPQLQGLDHQQSLWLYCLQVKWAVLLVLAELILEFAVSCGSQRHTLFTQIVLST